MRRAPVLALLAALPPLAALPLLAALPASQPAGAAPPAAMSFAARSVASAVSMAWDLYEPAVAVAPDGTVYVSGHAPATATERAPAFASRDDGVTWAALPGGMAGGEGVVVAGPGGDAWMFDNGVESGTLYHWCDDGQRLCGTDPMAWQRSAGIVGCGAGAPGLLDDRPWLAAEAGKVVLVNNGAGAAQVGVEGAAAGPATWNMCAGQGWIPGPPALRDGAFAVPLVAAPRLAVLLAAEGHGPLQLLVGSDPQGIGTVTVLPDAPINLACGTDYGWAAWSARGTMFVAAANGTGAFTVAASRDLAHWRAGTFDAQGTLAYLWLSGSPDGEGALVSWFTSGDACLHADVHAAHVALADGPELRDASVVARDVVQPCGDYSGSALGPDGRAYVAVFSDAHGCLGTPGARPLTVYVQQAGPRT